MRRWRHYSAILRAGGREKLLRHRAAAEMVGCRCAPEPPFPCLVRRSFNEGGTPSSLFKPFYVRFSFLRSAKRKSGTKVWKGTGVHGGCKELISKMRGGRRRNGPHWTYKTWLCTKRRLILWSADDLNRQATGQGGGIVPLRWWSAVGLAPSRASGTETKWKYRNMPAGATRPRPPPLQ